MKKLVAFWSVSNSLAAALCWHMYAWYGSPWYQDAWTCMFSSFFGWIVYGLIAMNEPW